MNESQQVWEECEIKSDAREKRWTLTYYLLNNKWINAHAVPFRLSCKYDWLDLIATAQESVHNNAALVTIYYYNVALIEAIPHSNNRHLPDIMAAVATLLPPQLHLKCSFLFHSSWFESTNKREK